VLARRVDHRRECPVGPARPRVLASARGSVHYRRRSAPARYRPAGNALPASCLETGDALGELLYGTEISHRLDRPLEVEGDVLVEEHIAKAG